MQMKQLYETLDRRGRATRLRADSLELGRKGFPTFAEVARDEADIIDPPVREEYEFRRVRREAPRQRRA